MDQIRNIIVPTDFSPLSEAAAVRAGTLARLDGGAIHLVHAVRFPLVATPYEVSVPAAIWEGIHRGAQEKLEQLRTKLAADTGLTVTAQTVDSSEAVHAIAAAAEAREADLIVMGTHGRGGIQHAFLGSVAERALRTVDCPILAVKGDTDSAAKTITRILLAVDFSTHSDRAVETAAVLAKRLGASVDVVHAFDLPADFLPYASPLGMEMEEKMLAIAGERLDRVRARLEQSRLPVTIHIDRGHPSRLIAELAEKIDCQLIVMGTRGNTGLAHVFLGSVAERTLRAAPCSVLAVKADEEAAD